MSELDHALYIVATPIGNLEDLSPRAQFVLRQVDCIAAEDTRRTKILCSAVGIKTTLLSYHDGNERSRAKQLIAKLRQEQSIALVSDAGTPLISDPGYRLVCAAQAAGLSVRAIPGPSALTAALSVAGLPTDRFVFEGFLPARAKARAALLLALQSEQRTLVFFEAPHRLAATLADISNIFGAKRELMVARELSKYHETSYRGSAAELAAQATSDKQMTRGEIVIVAQGASQDAAPPDELHMLRVLLQELGVAQGSKLAALLTGGSRRTLYQKMLALSKQSSP